MRRLDVHGPVYRQGPAIQGGINLERVEVEEELRPPRPAVDEEQAGAAARPAIRRQIRRG